LVRFAWDPKKAAANDRKHGVSFVEATTVFADALAELVDDAIHPERAIIVGESSAGRLLVVVFEDRGGTVRIISSRLATRAERRRYEQGKQT
jgi:uncharacterized DUF497 family protein